MIYTGYEGFSIDELEDLIERQENPVAFEFLRKVVQARENVKDDRESLVSANNDLRDQVESATIKIEELEKELTRSQRDGRKQREHGDDCYRQMKLAQEELARFKKEAADRPATW